MYVGESSRTLAERAIEHVRGARALDRDNFITKHWVIQHPSLERPPRVKFKPIKTYKDALSRLVSKAVWIDFKANLNSKGEWRSNKVTRLKVEKSTREMKKEESAERSHDKELDEGIARLRLLSKISRDGRKNVRKLREVKKPELAIYPKRTMSKPDAPRNKRMRLQCDQDSGCQSVLESKGAVEVESRGQF